MLNRLHTLCFEFDESGGAPADVDDSGAPDPGADVEEDTGAQAAAIDFTAPEMQDALRDVAREEFGALLQGLAEQQGGGEVEVPELDPYGDPAGFMGALQQTFGQIVDQRFSQIQPTVQAFEDQQNQAKVDEWASVMPAIKEAQDLLGEGAEDLPENAASLMAQFAATGYLSEMYGRYGNETQAQRERSAQAALRIAADQVKQIVKASHDAGYQARNNELRGLSSAPAPTPIGSRESVQIEDEPANELEAAERYIARKGLQ